MPKQLNVNMSFTADTSQAKRQLQELKQSLNDLTANSIKTNIGKEMDADLQKAVASTQRLKGMLEEATNPKTGNLDLSKFSDEIHKGGQQIEYYGEQLRQLGPEGAKAFMQLSQSIATAEMPMKRTLGIVERFGVTLANAARWQISSSVLHGFMGAVQGAYGYAQDLNKSLNSIRIVTGASTDEMSKFADQANKAAQSLSTSTLAYTDAALIFYQQGLPDEQIAERVETTLKMSNITGESADDVASYMTAIWNNFDDGTSSLESFADKITALGAATASSSKEIAGGLQQFAAIANTVGLSYDYAATALATVVAQTRQSESTVGNAFRTIFSRIEGLKMGDTLEDGTDLNKYSAAIESIGVKVKDQNSELRAMDDILDDIGAKWQQLSRDQQVALAQTVGGVRQYTNLIALFDNWDKFQKNLSVTQSAEGALQGQADLYAESWEAAQKRVQAAWQAIYQDLIDDKFFISILNWLEKILQKIDSFIKTIGGLNGVIAAIGAVITTVFAKDIAKGIENTVYNFKRFTGQAQDEADKLAQAWADAGYKMAQDLADQGFSAQSNVLKDQIDFTVKLREHTKEINDENRKWLLSMNEITKQYGEAYIEVSKIAEQKGNDYINKRDELMDKAFFSVDNGLSMKDVRAKFETAQGTFNINVEELKSQEQAVKDFTFSMKESKQSIDEQQISLGELYKKIPRVTEAYNGITNLLDQYNEILGEEKEGTIDTIQAQKEKAEILEKINSILNDSKNQQDALNSVIAETAKNLQKEHSSWDLTAKDWAELAKLQIAAKNATNEAEQALANYELRVKEAELEFEQAKVKMQSYSEAIVSTAQGFSQLTMAITSISTAFKELDNEDLSWSKRISNAIPSLISGLSSGAFAFKTLAKEGTFTGDAIKKVSLAFSAGKIAAGSFAGGLKAAAIAAAELLGPLLLVAAAIAGIIWLIKDFKSKSLEGQLEASNKKLEEASKKADEAANAYEKLKNSLKEYGEIQKEINEMEPGVEKAQAILDENEKILSFLNENNLWETMQENGGIKYDSNGLIEIDEALQKILTSKAYENKLTEKQIEYTEKLKNLELERDKNYKDTYTGKKFIGKIYADVDGDGEFSEEEKNSWTSGGEYTLDIAKALGKSGLTLDSIIGNKDAVKTALENSDNESLKMQVDDVMLWLEELANGSQADIEAFNKLATSVNTTELAMEAYKMSMAQMAVGSEVSQLTQSSNAQEAILEEFIKLDPEAQQSLQKALEEGSVSIADAFTNAGINVAEIIHNAMVDAAQGVANKAATVYQTEGELGFSEDDKIFQRQIDFVMSLSDEELAAYGGWEGLQKAVDNIAQQHNIELNVKASDFSQLKSSVKDEDIMKEVQQFADYLENHLDTIDDLSSHLKDCRAELEKIAYSIMRFDDAIQDVTQNYNDWSAALAAGGMRAASVFDDLAKAYGNVLDIDGDLLSGKFLDVQKNLDDMKLAIEGNEEAYSRLQEAAARDYMSETIGSNINQINELYNVIDSYADELSKLNPGDVLPEADFSGLYAALNEYIANLGLTVDQAQALMSMLGWDADVDSFETKEVDKAEGTDINAEAVETDQIAEPNVSSMSLPGGGTMSPPLPVYGIKVTGKPADLGDSVKTTTATVVGIKPGGLHKKAGGNIKYSKSTHGGGGVSPSKGGSGGGGGGGKGSEPKKKTKKEHKENKFLEDRYHNIKSAIDEVAKALERVDKLKERAYGKAKLKYMDQEIDKLQDQVRLQNEYIKQAKQYLNIDRKALEGLGLGAKFTDDGRLLNYEQVLKGIEDEYNSAVAAYNEAVDVYNSTEFQDEAEDEAFEANEKMMEAAEKKLNRSQEILKQYEETYNTLQEQIDKRTELLYQIYDAKLAKAVWKVEIKIEVNEADIKYLEWMNKFLEKFETNTLDVMANLSKMADDTFSNIEAIQSGMSELFENHGIKLDFNNLDGKQLADQLKAFMETEGLGSEITEEEAKQIRDWNEKLMQYVDNWVDYWTKTHELIDKTSEEWNKKIDREIDKLEMFTEILDHYSNIIDLTGSQLNVSDEDVLKIHDAKIRNGENELESLRAQRDGVLAELQAARTNLANAQTDEAKKFWEDHVKGFEDTLNELDSKIRSQWEDVLQWAKDRFDKALEASSKKFESRFNNLTLLMERFDRQLEMNHLYLDDYEKYYELNKDAKELEKMINNTNNSMMKSKYSDYLDEINGYMSSGVKLSQAQTDLIAKRVELLKAEDDLLNARNAKNTVRMTRDNEGNFSYTYTADEDAINDAALGVQEAFYNYENALRTGKEDMQQGALQINSNYNSDLTDLTNRLQSGALNQEQYDQAVMQLQEKYNAEMNKYLEQMQFFYDEEARLRDEDWQNLQEITELKLAEYDDFVTEFRESILGTLMEDITSESEFVEQSLDAAAQLLADNIATTQQWEEDIKAICEAAGVDVDTFRETMVNDLMDIDQKSNETKENITIMANQMKEDMNSIMKKALEMDQDWATHMQSMREQIANTVYAMNVMLATLADLSSYEHLAGDEAEYAAGLIREAGNAAEAAAEQVRELADAYRDLASAMAEAGANPGSGGETIEAPNIVPSYSANGTIYGGPNAGKVGHNENGQIWVTQQTSDSDWYKYTDTYRQASRSTKKVIDLNGGFSTGGYTGAWGNEGKFAMLHEKELVLNKEDTSNILGVVNTVRDMAKSINFNEGLNGFVNSIMNAGKLAFAGAQDLNQNVHIEASFPNVQSHSEIELALNNLINSATQYVNRS